MNKHFTKLIAVVLCVSMLLPMVLSNTVFGAETTTPTITVEDASVCAGNDFTVDVIASNNPGISAFTFNIDYDSDELVLNSITVNTALGGQAQKYSNRVVWLSSADVSYNGTFLTLSFSTKSDTAVGDYEISVSYTKGDICNRLEEDVDFTVIPGTVSVVDVLAGDINDDGYVNNKDLVRLMRYMAGEEIAVVEKALDVNGDTNVNNKDLVRLMRYLAGEPGIEIFPKAASCRHTMEAIEAKAPGCLTEGNIAYWHCTKCDKYFTDEAGLTKINLEDTVIASKGHSVVVDAAVEPTYDKEGLTEGSHCSVCKAILVEQTKIPKLTKDSGSIVYYFNENDTYLCEHLGDVSNPNPDIYYVQDGLSLSNNVKFAGYTFDGWYDGFSSTATKITKIPAGTTGTVELYAHFEKDVYELTLSDNINGDKTINYTVDKGASLGKNPEWAGYNFIGWCDSNNNLVTSIPVGSTGNQKLYANWTSKRNQARPVSKLSDPIVLEDIEKGEILFTYEIGSIENIPLSQISDVYQNTKGMKQTFSTSEQVSVSETNAKEIANSISNATVNSSSWTLSEDWNDVTAVSESYAEGQGWSKQEAETKSKTSSNTYSVNSSSGGSSSTVTNTGVSGTLSADRSNTSSGSVSHTKETGSEFEISASNSTTVGIGANINASIPGVGSAGASANVSNTFDIGASYSNYDKNTDSATLSASQTGSQGASLTQNTTTTTSGSSSWNSSSGYSNSQSTSSSESVVNVLSGTISESKSYGTSHSAGGSNSENFGCQNSNTESNEYSSSVSYNTSTVQTNTKTIELGGDNEGYYRFVLAGTAHVFAVVGYDIASRSYYVFTYSVMDDNTYTYIDYSKETANFNDYEFGVLPFEIPYLVKSYVDYRVGYTQGLQINTSTGTIDSYNGTEKNVFVPAYMSVDNIDGNGNPGVVKVNGISKSAFENNTDIEGISLGGFIDEIPENAFSGCTSLKQIISPGVVKIGKDAFAECTSLEEFLIPKEIQSLDVNAFTNVSKLSVVASNNSVANSTVVSGAKQIVLNISTPNKVSGKYEVPNTVQSFELQGGNKQYSDITINSNAKYTLLNGLSINSSSGSPVIINSSKLSLNGVNITAVGFGLVLKSDATIQLRQTNAIISDSEKAMLCKNVTFEQADQNVTGSLDCTGDILYWGIHSGDDYVCFKEGKFVSLSETEYNQYLVGMYKVVFDANGGSTSEASRIVYYGQSIGTLPVPTRTGFSFDGWYTEKIGGTKITDNQTVSFTSDTTIYSHWNAKEYKATWKTGTGYTIKVSRTSSPNKGAATGVLSSGNAIYYGDVLSITYTKADYYTIKTKGETSITVSGNVTESDIYATAELNPLSGWVKTSEVPSGAKTVNTKWKYDLTSYTTSSSSTLSGWTRYDSKITGHGDTQGPVYSDPSNGLRKVWSESYVVSSNYATKYVYYRYAANEYGGNGAPGYSSTFPYYFEYWFDSPLEKTSNVSFGGSSWSRWKYWYSSSNWMGVYGETAKDVWVSDNYGTRWYYQEPVYTYYFKKTESKESTSDPTGQANVSNVVKYVQYREK